MEKTNIETKETNKKNITIGTAVKGLINGCVAYGILLFFIFFIITVLINWSITTNSNLYNNNILLFTIPSIGAILIFFLVRGICKLSTFDLFKKCKINSEDINSVSNKMNIFFICCIFFSVIIIILSLLAKTYNEQTSINQLSNMYYSSNSKEFAEELTSKLIDEFETHQSHTLIQTIILEYGLLLGIFSLIPTQKRLIEKYNLSNQ